MKKRDYTRGLTVINLAHPEEKEKDLNGIPSMITYSNRMNDIGFYGLNLRESRLFMTIVAGMYDKGDGIQKFTFAELKSIMGEDPNTSRKDFNEIIEKAAEKMAGTRIRLISDSGIWKIFLLFSNFEGDPVNGTITVQTNKDFLSLLNNLNANYTKVDLKEYNSLGSKYSQILFRKLSQFKNIHSKTCYITLDNLKRIFEIDEKDDIDVKHINQKLLLPAIKELNSIPDFKYLRLDKEKMKGQRPISIYYFVWSKPKESKKQ